MVCCRLLIPLQLVRQTMDQIYPTTQKLYTKFPRKKVKKRILYLFSNIILEIIALNVFGLISRSSCILYIFSLKRNNCDTLCTSVARPDKPTNVLSFNRNTFWKSVAIVCPWIPSRVSLYTKSIMSLIHIYIQYWQTLRLQHNPCLPWQ